MPFAAAGAVAAVAAPLISSAVSGGGTSAAAGAANAAQKEQLDYAKSIQAPYLNAGTGALAQQNALLGLSGQDAATNAMSTFQQSPGYGFAVQQGLSAVDNAAAVRGEIRGGNVLRQEQTLGNNLANQEFTNYFGRLQNLVTAGTGAANTLTNAAFQTGSGIASTDTSAAAQQANINANTAKAVGTGLQSGLNNYAYLNGGSTNALFGAGGAFSGAGTTSIPVTGGVGAFA